VWTGDETEEATLRYTMLDAGGLAHCRKYLKKITKSLGTSVLLSKYKRYNFFSIQAQSSIYSTGSIDATDDNAKKYGKEKINKLEPEKLFEDNID
jgi:hypothetical protein